MLVHCTKIMTRQNITKVKQQNRNQELTPSYEYQYGNEYN